MSTQGGKRSEGTSAVSLRAWSVLMASTLAFLVCFAVWMMFGVLGVPCTASSGCR